MWTKLIAFVFLTVAAWGQIVNNGGTGSGSGGSGGNGGQYSTASATYTTSQGTYYFPAGGGLAASTTEGPVQTLQASAGTIQNLAATLSANAGSSTLTFTFRQNAGSSTVTCSITGATNSCKDTTHSFQQAVGDLTDIQVTVTGANYTGAIILTWATPGLQGPAGSGNNTFCADASGSGTTYTCPSPSPSVSTLTGLLVGFIPQTTNTGSATLNVAGLGAKTLKQSDCATNLSASALTGGDTYTFQYNGTVFCQASSSGGGGMVYPGAGIPNSTGSAWGTSYSTSGSGNVCLTISCAMTTPNLGTPSAVTLTNGSGLPISGITGLATGIPTWLATPSGANFASALTSPVPSGAGGTGVANTATLTLGSSNVNLATLGTGIVKNTTTTGNLTDAASSDVIGLWTGTCSSSTFLRGDGSCQTPSGSGNVSTTGSPAQYQVSVFSGSTTITGASVGTAGRLFIDQGASAYPAFEAMSGDCTLASTGAITCTKSNGTNFGTAAFDNTGTSGATIPLLNGTNTWSAVQTFNNSDIRLLGSSTGYTTLSSANSSSSNYTITVPAATDTMVTLAATQSLTNKSIVGSEINSGTVGAAYGGTGVSNTATLTLGTSNQNWSTIGTGIVKVTTSTGAITDAVAADVYGLWSGSCSGTTFLRGDGACATPSGGAASPGATHSVSFSATPTLTGSSATEGTVDTFVVAQMSANITSVSLATLTPGQIINIDLQQASSGGPYTVTWGSSFVGSCAVSPYPSAHTKSTWYISSGPTATLTAGGCVSDSGPAYGSTFARSGLATPASGYAAATDTSLIPYQLGSDGNYRTMVKELSAGNVRCAGGANTDDSACPQNLLSAPGYAAGGGSANAQTVTLSPAVSTCSAGLTVKWTPTAANTTTTPTLAVGSCSAATIVKEPGNAALAANDLTTTTVANATFDGTYWELQNPQTSSGGGGTTNLQSQTFQVGGCGSGGALIAAVDDYDGSNNGVCGPAGSGLNIGFWKFDDSAADTIDVKWEVPSNWNSSTTFTVRFHGQGLGSTSGNVGMKVDNYCYTDTSTMSGAPTFNTAAEATVALSSTNYQTKLFEVTGVSATGCHAKDLMLLRLYRDNTVGSNYASYLLVSNFTLQYQVQ